MSESLELPDGSELFRVDFKVRPTDAHPLRWKSACGILSIWTFAKDKDEAISYCLTVVAVMPFHITDDEVLCSNKFAAINSAIGIVADQAEYLGFSAFYDAYDHNADERDIPFPGEKAVA